MPINNSGSSPCGNGSQGTDQIPGVPPGGCLPVTGAITTCGGPLNDPSVHEYNPLDGLQDEFNVLGYIPDFGSVFNFFNGLIYAGRGQFGNAGISMLGVIPGEKDAAGIDKVHKGDKVLATDPQTGQTSAEPVRRVLVHSGMHSMVDVHLSSGATITATSHHAFWDATTGAFTYASGLRTGDRLDEPGGQHVTVTGIRVYRRDVTAYNLTVRDIHTYYAGTTPVLVHNTTSTAPGTLTTSDNPPRTHKPGAGPAHRQPDCRHAVTDHAHYPRSCFVPGCDGRIHGRRAGRPRG